MTHANIAGMPISNRKHAFSKLVNGLVCETCNNGWMSQLEGDCQNHIINLMNMNELETELAFLNEHHETVAKWAFKNVILLNSATNYRHLVPDEHYKELAMMEEELKAFRTLDGKPYRLLPLPMASAVYDEEHHRLPATYANFLIMNEAVLYPTYADSVNDMRAKEVLAEAFPGREIVGIDCTALIKQHGSLHCVTMQYPEGVY